MFQERLKKEFILNKLTVEQQATNYETMQHIREVGILLHRVAAELLSRADDHDQSKLSSPEVEMFTEMTPKLANSVYGSEEYNEFRKKLDPILQHHYANNRHHPEHFKNGINDMNLIDLLEMFCDWKASSKRHSTGNIRKSIEINAPRFGINQQLVNILENTADYLDF